jgi:peptidoglycan/LPS O-acetylase OafA/YrhL
VLGDNSLVTSAPIAAPITPFNPAGNQNYSIAIGYLRAVIILGVVAVHSVIAYCSFAPLQIRFGTKSDLWEAYPIVDGRRWIGFDPIVGFTDPFAMSLMFFLSGLFVWNSLQRKGVARFGGERAARLGLPFAVAVVFLAPAAYYPTYLVSAGSPPLKAFLRQWLSLGEWPSGPAWFIWILLAYDFLAAVFFLMMRQLGDRPTPLYAWVFGTPTRFFWTVTAISGIAYIPIALSFGPGRWTVYGPFMFQTSRLAHYAVWFFAGFYAGVYGIHRGVIAPGGALAQNWLRWLGWAWAAYGVLVVVTHPAIRTTMSPFWRELVAAIAWVQSCTAGALCLLAVFLRFGHTRIKIMDSLCQNSYGIYLIHYVFVIWLQYFLLRAPLAALAKGSIVFLGALSLSWASIGTLRRLPGVAHII